MQILVKGKVGTEVNYGLIYIVPPVVGDIVGIYKLKDVINFSL